MPTLSNSEMCDLSTAFNYDFKPIRLSNYFTSKSNFVSKYMFELQTIIIVVSNNVSLLYFYRKFLDTNLEFAARRFDLSTNFPCS